MSDHNKKQPSSALELKEPITVSLRNRLRQLCSRNVSTAITTPIFILGNQKSGTSAITALLGEATGKTYVIDIFYRLTPPLESQLLSNALSLRQFVKRSRYWFSADIIKEPTLTFFFPELRQLFPSARFVFIARDPRDNIRSILNRLNIAGNLPHLSPDNRERLADLEGWRLILEGQAFGHRGRNYIETLANRWNFFIDIYQEYRESMDLIRYEDFIQDKVSQISGLASRMGENVVRDISAKADTQYQPAGDNRIAWIDFFGPKNLSLIESICGERMNSMGYPLSYSL